MIPNQITEKPPSNQITEKPPTLLLLVLESVIILTSRTEPTDEKNSSRSLGRVWRAICKMNTVRWSLNEEIGITRLSAWQTCARASATDWHVPTPHGPHSPHKTFHKTFGLRPMKDIRIKIYGTKGLSNWVFHLSSGVISILAFGGGLFLAVKGITSLLSGPGSLPRGGETERLKETWIFQLVSVSHSFPQKHRHLQPRTLVRVSSSLTLLATSHFPLNCNI